MGQSLRSLEQSLAKTQQGGDKFKQGNRSRRTGTEEGLSVLAPIQLQEQIDVIRGRRVGQPTSCLRTLEDRVLGRTPSVQPSREILRLDQGQVAPPLPTQNQTTAPPVAPSNNMAAIQWRSQPLNASSPVSAAAYPYAPEFSAPGTGRFQVESFANEPASPDNLFRPDAAVSTAPSNDHADDSTGWLTQAQSEQPKEITDYSKKSIDSSLALAKDDFERDLAVILGQSVAPATSAQDTLFNATQTPAPSPAKPAQPALPDPNAPPPHPSHDVFDQMGLAMRYANSFDLGNVNLNDRFNCFERELEQPAKVPARAATASVSYPFVDPMNLDEFDLVAELAVIGSERPDQLPIPNNNQQNITDKTAGEDYDQQIG